MTKFLTLLILMLFQGCQSESRFSLSEKDPLKYTELLTPKGEAIETTLAISSKDQEQGLSGIKPEDFKDNQGMLFFYVSDADRHFWMPDTYFDLDLFYLDKDLKIVDIIRKLPFYIGRNNPELIPRARGVWCRHTLEMKASSPLAQSLAIGDKLSWKSSISLVDLEEKLRKEPLN